jgi:glycerophosphoryl diester phosphodiesterase
MPGLDWLTAKPFAHRGLHDASAGILENTASAVSAAIDAGYAIEMDLQRSADGEAMVFHDTVLDRLTDGHGRFDAVNTANLKRLRLKNTDDRIPTLGEVCEVVGGRAPLLLELKSESRDDLRLVERVIQVLTGYSGPVAVMSFNPNLVTAVRKLAPDLPRGITAERYYSHEHWNALSSREKTQLGFLLHLPTTRPHFIAYAVHDLPAVAPQVAHFVLGLPILAWTVRTEDDRRRAKRWANQMIFEGFRP